ncbi:VOC family protein [Methanoregula formicica]|uniref:Lactoylglutathione lyase family protein n=1 Tax=Methanoregula formicica (strain DSM 22288 / NBRC 105244 / SMSP) TaxID=593750 RepID=L0HF29_METFS|nr:VOC family protein [Methanoregula formicica]AGB01674.1 lactoylglutathione lyase family protein [Methanoregula formicica SMSP]
MIPDCRLTAFVLFVSNIERSKRFYQNLLGLEIEMDLGVNVGFRNGLALWQKDFALNVIHGKQTPPVKGNDIEIYFETGSIEDAWETVCSQGVEVVHELREQPWGQRVFRVYDPDRFIVEFGEPMPAVILRMHREGMTEEEIAKKTTMPAEIMHQILVA